jgi:hypothetical protein
MTLRALLTKPGAAHLSHTRHAEGSRCQQVLWESCWPAKRNWVNSLANQKQGNGIENRRQFVKVMDCLDNVSIKWVKETRVLASISRLNRYADLIALPHIPPCGGG